jgi:hypothetical protein
MTGPSMNGRENCCAKVPSLSDAEFLAIFLDA